MRYKVRKLKSKLEKAVTEKILVAYKNKTITINFEQKFKEFNDFYKKNKIDVPVDFKDSICSIWESNIDPIQKAILGNGFDEILIIPPINSLPDLHQKMVEGYNPTFQGDNFRHGGSFAGAQSQNMDKPHIVLIHKMQNLKDCSEIKQTLNIKGQYVKQEEVLTLEEYLIFQRKYFEETQKHLDENMWTWLSTKLNTRLVGAGWHQTRGELRVNAGSQGTQREDLGARPSCSFF